MEPSSAPDPVDLSPADRLRRSEEAGRALVAGWEASGLSMRAYATRVGVRPQRLSYWRLRLAPRAASANGAGDPAGFIELRHPGPVRAEVGAPVVLTWPQGLRLEIPPGADVALLRTVLSVLGPRDVC